MADALNANWEGFEALHRKILSFKDRYGNGIAALAMGFSDADTEIKKAEDRDGEDGSDN